jgi:hypothetical protein
MHPSMFLHRHLHQYSYITICTHVTTCATYFTHPHVQLQKTCDGYIYIYTLHAHVMQVSKYTVRILAKASTCGEC